MKNVGCRMGKKKKFLNECDFLYIPLAFYNFINIYGKNNKEKNYAGKEKSLKNIKIVYFFLTIIQIAFIFLFFHLEYKKISNFLFHFPKFSFIFLF